MAEEDQYIGVLFDHWLAASRVADAALNDEAFYTALDERDRYEEQIARCAGGTRAIAIKTYLLLRRDGHWAPKLEVLRAPYIEHMKYSLLKDVSNAAPELAPLLAPVTDEDAALINADIEIQWCEEQMADDPSHRAEGSEIDQILLAALDVIGRTPAKTDRGRQIRFKHWGL
jgi:hypothetical protein